MAQIGIVTVLYNSERVLYEFFRSLDKQSFKDFTLYVIDNASSDDSLNKAMELSKDVSFQCVFFPEPKNWGIAKGNNIGIKAALKDGCEYVLLSNNDVVLNNTDTIELMLNRIKQGDVGIITPKICLYSNPTIIWAAGGMFKKPAIGIKHIGAYQQDCEKYNEDRIINYSPTCFVLITKGVFDSIGMMDETFFVYCDDTDFMYRAKEHGIKILYFPQTSILHNESACTGKGSEFKIYQISKNQLIYVKKYFSGVIYCYLLIRNILVHNIIHRFTFNKNQNRAEAQGIKDGIRFNKDNKNHQS